MRTASDTPAPVAAPSPRTAGWWAALRPLLLRLHFYAGVFVAPFLVASCLTGLAYAFSPQLGDLVYGHELVAGPHAGPPRSLDDLVAAARVAHPEGTLASVVDPADPNRTTGVVLAVPGLPEGLDRTVYVDPYTAEVRGGLDTWHDMSPLQTTLADLHRGLLLGPRGVLYSELAASWLWVVGLGGLALWVGRWRRQRPPRRLATLAVPPTDARPGRRRVLGWHGATGVWLVVALLVVSATGLPMTRYAGGHARDVLAAVGATPQVVGAAVDVGGGAPSLQAAPVPVRAAPRIAVATALDRARTAGLTGPVRITVPATPGAPFTVAETGTTWPVQRDAVALDPYTGAVTETVRWADWPLPARLARIGILAHTGTLFGLAGQVALAATVLGLLCMIFWGYRMWWQRRPTRGRRRLAAPVPRGTLRGLPWPLMGVVVLVTAAIGWALPLLGASLLVFLAGDVALGLLARRRA